MRPAAAGAGGAVHRVWFLFLYRARCLCCVVLGWAVRPAGSRLPPLLGPQLPAAGPLHCCIVTRLPPRLPPSQAADGYQLQDLRCAKCGSVAASHLQHHCDVCGGHLRATQAAVSRAGVVAG